VDAHAAIIGHSQMHVSRIERAGAGEAASRRARRGV